MSTPDYISERSERYNGHVHFTNGPNVRFHRTTPAAKGTTDVHAAVAGNAASNTFPGPFTNPAQPRNLRLTMATSYDGGDVVVAGTNQFDEPISETFATGSNVVRVGSKVFKTITGATKAAVGANAATVSIGTGDKIALPFRVGSTVGTLQATTTNEAVTVDAVEHAFTPTTAPNGAIVFTLLVAV
jgi:hypothetical protein